MGQQGRDCDWMGVWNEYKLKQQNYMSKLISKTVHSLPQSPTASIPSPSPPWKAHHPQSTRFYTEQPAKDEHERQGQDNCSSSVEVASFSCERLCQACEAEEAGVECLGCGAVGLCAGCFQRLHARGKFVGHRWKKLTPGINPESLNTLSIPIPQPPHSQPIPRSPRSRNCLPQKENKIPPHQLPQLLQNELTSFNIKYQAYINEISSQALRVRNKWRQFQEVIEGEIQGLRAAVLGGIGKLRERDLGDVQGRFGELERVRLEVQKYQQGQAKALNEGQLWEKVRNCNLKMADSQEMKALMLQRSSLDCKTTCNIRPISNQIKKLLGKINLTENNSIPRQDYSVLVDSRLSQPLDQSIINIKKPKLQKPRPLQKKKQKRQNTTANTSLNSSFLLVLSEPDHKNGKIKKVKSQSTIPLQPMKHTPFMKINKRNKIGEAFAQLIK